MLPGQDSGSLFRAIRENRLEAVRAANAEAVNKPGPMGLTPLMYAAAFGSREAMTVLLEKGAAVNAKDPRQGTAMHYAAWDPARVEMLAAKGAAVDEATKLGRTPLLIAGSSPGGAAAMAVLLRLGAKPTVKDKQGGNLLMGAIAGPPGAAEGLAKAGLAAKEAAGSDGLGPLHVAASVGRMDRVQWLLEQGVDVNAVNTFAGRVKFGDIALKGLTPLMVASSFSGPKVPELLLARGAKIDSRDVRGLTALHFAVATDRANTETVKLLLAKGADRKAKSVDGETVEDWARKYNHPTTLAALGLKPASPAAKPVAASELLGATTPRAGAEKAMGLLIGTSRQFFRESGCAACHHTMTTAMAVGAARKAGLPLEAGIEKELEGQLQVNTAMFGPMQLEMLDLGGTVDTAGFQLVGLAAVQHAPDAGSDAFLQYLALNQLPDGSWDKSLGISRAPIEETVVGHTAFAVRALQAYVLPGRQAEFQERIGKAKEYLWRAQPVNAYEQAERLLGLAWAGASAEQLRAAADGLVAAQRADGGWSQTPYLASDAYATGMALYALGESGQTARLAEAKKKAQAYLLRTQHKDGSWYVASRALKFQPYFESGFPYGHDQWISAMATGYAAIGLMQ